ncbi:hypothetical protein [Streptomyces sp. SPB162]|nr:hypothetical protein [Streptomyces sp. SPB162]MDF9810912.1 hypothetical protein [Streptomyces sp. SPB162]
MDPLTFEYGDLHPRVDRGVFELFGPADAGRAFRPATLADRRAG